MCWFQTRVFGSAILLRSGCRVVLVFSLLGASHRRWSSGQIPLIFELDAARAPGIHVSSPGWLRQLGTGRRSRELAQFFGNFYIELQLSHIFFSSTLLHCAVAWRRRLTYFDCWASITVTSIECYPPSLCHPTPSAVTAKALRLNFISPECSGP